MEASVYETEVVEIGRYKFSVKAFEWSTKILAESIHKNYDEIIIDEIGPLELQGKGFAEVLKLLLKHSEIKSDLFLVVRDKAVQQVLDYFKISEKEVLLQSLKDIC